MCFYYTNIILNSQELRVGVHSLPPKNGSDGGGVKAMLWFVNARG